MNVSIKGDPIKADFLVIGGGIGGLQAAITAARAGLSVVVAEKADTRRSGMGANGNDHFFCYIPEVHGDFERAIRENASGFVGGPWVDMSLLRILVGRSNEIVKDWEAMGINMRPTGQLRFEGHSLPGQQLYHLKFDGKNQKGILTKVAKSLGVRIINHVAVNELLTNEGRATGAIGVSIAEDMPELVLFQAKAVLIASGGTSRLYPEYNPAYMFNLGSCPANCGAGHAMALRAGARLVNIDIPGSHAGPKYFQRGGKGTWIGISCDIHGEPVTPYIGKPSRELGDVTADVWPGVYRDKMLDGTGPVYMNCTGLSEEDHAYMREAFKSEGIDSIYDNLDQHGIDLRKSMVEFGTFNFGLSSKGIEISEKAESSIPGLYAAGDVVGNVKGAVTSATVFGMIAGENAAAYVKTVPELDISGHNLIAAHLELYSRLMSRVDGAHWKEANSMIQQLMNDYIGSIKPRSASLFKAGIKYIRDLRMYSLAELMAENSHELMRCLEVLDLIDIGEAVALSGEHRKESREMHKRVDYPYTNILLNNKFLTVARDPVGSFTMLYRDRH
jgi:succinate dehydrogenase/fumarate reductase flavoprotein subunit